jgi:hypothetical protein
MLAERPAADFEHSSGFEKKMRVIAAHQSQACDCSDDSCGDDDAGEKHDGAVMVDVVMMVVVVVVVVARLMRVMMIVVVKTNVSLTYNNAITSIRCQGQVCKVSSGDARVTRHKVERVYDLVRHAVMQSIRYQSKVTKKPN